MSKITYPNLNNCTVNLANSILKEFGVNTYHDTMKSVDNLLKDDYENIIVMLLDGMGTNVMKENLSSRGFFYKNIIETYSAIFPPTTVAATTSIDSGLYPIEHSWLGWDMYFTELQKNITVFLNKDQDTGLPSASYNVAETLIPYKSIVSLINDNGGQAYYAMPFKKPFYEDFNDQCDYILSLCRKPGKKYIYCYNEEPDHTMHRCGIDSKSTYSELRSIESRVSQLFDDIEAGTLITEGKGHIGKTLLLITADHGHINSRSAAIRDYPRIMDCLKRLPSIEPRALNLFIKDGFRKQFLEEWNAEFGNDFILISHEEIYEKNLFGLGQAEQRFDTRIGDYIAIAVSDLSIFNTREEARMMIGVHAGLTKEELEIPLIALKTE